METKEIKSLIPYIYGKNISNEDIDDICRSLYSFRKLIDKTIEYPEDVLYNLFEGSFESSCCYRPIDICELRLYFIENKIASSPKALFTLGFCKKYLSHYPLFLEFSNKMCQKKSFGEIFIDTNEDINVKRDIKRIYIQYGVSQTCLNTIKEIIKSENINVEIAENREIPGVNKSKIASVSMSSGNKYIVNLGLLNLKEVVLADSEENAIKKAINKRWNKIKNKYILGFRPEIYNIDYWLKYKNTPFWKTLVYSKNKVAQREDKNTDPYIKFDDQEQKIILFIKSGLDYIENKYNVVIDARIAGGFVRDKISGRESKDIDIALSNISGLSFAQKLKEYDEKNRLGATGDIYSTSLLKVKDENANIPDSAKLEVASLTIYGLPVEFVSLRTEIYDSESRTPMTFPTNNPVEDAKRRDLSINSLYYNIKTGQIEDYVNGLKDFEKQGNLYIPKILRTPMNAEKTFEDDPLRILRVLRFYSRYPNTQIDPSIIRAFSNEKVQKAYKKLSPERSSTEIRKMMEGPNVINAAKILFDTNLYKLVFGTPSDWHDIDINQKSPYHNLTVKGHTLAVMNNLLQIAKENDLPKEETGLLLLSAMFHDFGKLSPNIRKPKINKETNLPNEEHYQYIGHEKESAIFAKQVMEHMAFTPEEKKFVYTLIKNHMLNTSGNKMSNKQIGNLLAKTQGLWRNVIRHYTADKLGREGLSQEEIERIKNLHSDYARQVEEYEKSSDFPFYNTPFIDGNIIKDIIKSTVPELAKANPFLDNAKDSKGKKIHYLKYIIDKLIEALREKNVQNEKQAKKYVISVAKGLWNKIKNMKSSSKGYNWFKKAEILTKEDLLNSTKKANRTFEEIRKEYNEKFGKNHHHLRLVCAKCGNSETCRCKEPKITEVGICDECSKKKITTADASSGSKPGGYGYEEPVPLGFDEKGIAQPSPVVLKRYHEGAKVRLHRDSTRGGSLWGEQTMGVISKIERNIMTIRWLTGNKKGKISRLNIYNPIQVNNMIDIID